jgi:ABC-type glycerol-3-phosphate transport system substrate-binding protein
MFIKSITFAGAVAFLSSSAYAGCGISSGSIKILSNDFAAINAVTSAASACAGDGVKVSITATKENRDIQVAALTANPSVFTSSVVGGGSLVPLLNDGLVRPLDDLVAKHGSTLNENQLVKIDGKIMAIAFMANAQHFFYRSDILEQAGVDAPKTYEDVLLAAKAIRSSGIMEYPFALNTKAGWNLGEEFINMYMGSGGQLFKAGTAEASVNNANGVATLNLLKELLSFSNPDFLTFDSNATQALWEAGNLAMATMWGSRGGPILDDEGSTNDITSNTVLAAAPTWGGKSIPASTLWWDGFTIAKKYF